MNVIHFITDDKFLNDTISLLNEIKEIDNRFVCVTQDDRPFEFLNANGVERIHYTQIPPLISEKTADVIVLHNFYSLPSRYIKVINKDIKVVWLSWGFDIYSNRYPQAKLIDIDHRIKSKTISPRYRLWLMKKYLKPCLRKLLRRKEREHNTFIEAIGRVDYFSGVFPIEYDMVKRNSYFHAKQFFFNYTTKKGVFTEDGIYHDLHPKGNTIQIGNSANKLGNHRNTLWRLRHLDLGNRQLFTPLSYGGDPLYTSSVCKMGKRLFGDKFVPLLDFMPSDEYVKLTQSISIAIHNIEQQAAVGNILLNLWNGAKVFLPEDSMGYRHFKELGYRIFSIEKELSQANIDTSLVDTDVINNRTLILRDYSFDAIKEKVRNSFMQIGKDLK